MQSTICDHLYIIQEIPGNGHGLVAATTVTKGTRILSESLLFRVTRGGNSKEQLRDSISKKPSGKNSGRHSSLCVTLSTMKTTQSSEEFGLMRCLLDLMLRQVVSS